MFKFIQNNVQSNWTEYKSKLTKELQLIYREGIINIERKHHLEKPQE